MTLEPRYDADGVTLAVPQDRRGALVRLLSRKAPADLDRLTLDDRTFALALADARALADEHSETIEIGAGELGMSHGLAARLDGRSAEALGLPPTVELSYRTDVEGALGTPTFRLVGEWYRSGRRETPTRTGAILHTAKGDRRLPHFLLEAVSVIEAFEPGDDLPAQWQALARFRKALDPGVRPSEDEAAAKMSMTDFLAGLEVRTADRFSITPMDGPDGLDFDPVPFSGESLARSDATDRTPTEADGELDPAGLAAFRQRVRTQGALPAYRTGAGQYLVVDAAAAPILRLMVEKQRAPAAERASFVRDPGPAMVERLEAYLRETGRLEGLTPQGEAELIDAASDAAFVATAEWSERVIGTTVYRRQESVEAGSGTTWLPEIFSQAVTAEIDEMDRDRLRALRGRVEEAITAGATELSLASGTLHVDNWTASELDARLAALENEDTGPADHPTQDEDAEGDAQSGPIVIKTRDNADELEWQPEGEPRETPTTLRAGLGVTTAMKPHQVESLEWQIAAWRAGLPGVLNADEQGLGKTLQTLAFLRWLREANALAAASGAQRGPILVVAPTSLLQNWEAEAARHLEGEGLGSLIRLYGAGVGAHKRTGAKGFDTQTGDDLLDLSLLREAIANGNGHRFWLLTTYTTLANYQYSLARLPFAAVVFDEIQALKNPTSLRALAARAVNADFRIGLTGTPIENAASDLWAVMDQLCPGALDSLKEFRACYGEASVETMADLHARVFVAGARRPALAIRRIKDEVARELPAKSRRLHPRLMPSLQADAYEVARRKLAERTPGAALKMLHHIRSVSVHPAMDGSNAADADFIEASARLAATFDILREIEAKKERALVFIENLKMQHRFVALARAAFGLARIDLINGSTPIARRQEIVDRFQRHLANDEGFDLLVLGPKAAGTGLTLTAATHVVHLSRWWNPAVEEQCNDRVHRIGQERPVTVHIPMAIHADYREHSFDCLLHSLMNRKRRLAALALWPMGDTAADAEQLENLVAAERSVQTGDPVTAAMVATFARDDQPLPERTADGSYPFA